MAVIEYNPADYRALLESIVSGRAKVVYGLRFLRKVRGMKLANRIANWILTKDRECAVPRLRAVRFEF